MSTDNAASSPPQFPSGIPNPPIFAKLGFKDRGYLRNNIELHAAQEREAIAMTTEQTCVELPDARKR